jgi:putative PIN family toxin of toxin-antitoxin system
MRVVLDANVFVSALISSQGAPARVVARWRDEAFDIVVSPAILSELETVLHYPRLQQRYNLPDQDIRRFIQLLRKFAVEVSPVEELDVVKQDAADNRYLECALAGGASVIVTGDRHLLDLGQYETIHILSPAGFLAFLELS